MPRKWYQPWYVSINYLILLFFPFYFSMEECYERKSLLPFDFFGRFPFGWMDNWYEHWGWLKRNHPPEMPIKDRPSHVINTLTDSHDELRELESGISD